MPDVKKQPSVRLQSWLVARFTQLETGEIWDIIYGWSIDDRCGRVSTPVAFFDPVAGTARTRSGRVYHLLGSPGLNRDADYTFACRFGRNTPEGWTRMDVSSTYWEQIQNLGC